MLLSMMARTMPRLPARAALRLVAPYRGQPPAATSALSRLFCSAAGDGSGDGAGDGKGRGRGKVRDATPSDKAERPAAEDASEPASLTEGASSVGHSSEEVDGASAAAPRSSSGARESSLVPLDPSNISTLPPVLIFPFPTRPLFPGVYQPAEVTDEALAKALMAVKVGSSGRPCARPARAPHPSRPPPLRHRRATILTSGCFCLGRATPWWAAWPTATTHHTTAMEVSAGLAAGPSGLVGA